jgi:hypothetical protein
VMSRATHDRYVAGLWELTFIYELTWFTSTQQGRIPEYTAPSWSWASMNGEISFYHSRYQDLQELASVSHIHLEYKGADSFGAVKTGYAKLTAPLLAVQWDGKKKALYRNGARLQSWQTFDDAPSIDEGVKDFIYLGLLMGTTQISEESCRTAVGLLLQCAAGPEPQFSRVGICNIFDSVLRPGQIYIERLDEEEAAENSTGALHDLESPKMLDCRSLSNEHFRSMVGYLVNII